MLLHSFFYPSSILPQVLIINIRFQFNHQLFLYVICNLKRQVRVVVICYVCFTEAEGGVCTEIQGSCLETSSCTRLCLESKGDKMVKSECRPPEVNPGTPPISYTMCFCSYICDQTSEETMWSSSSLFPSDFWFPLLFNLSLFSLFMWKSNCLRFALHHQYSMI